MANNPKRAPFTITGSTGTDANGKPTAIATVSPATYTISGDTALLAITGLAERLLMEGCDPSCALVCSPNTVQDIIQVV